MVAAALSAATLGLLILAPWRGAAPVATGPPPAISRPPAQGPVPRPDGPVEAMMKPTAVWEPVTEARAAIITVEPRVTASAEITVAPPPVAVIPPAEPARCDLVCLLLATLSPR